MLPGWGLEMVIAFAHHLRSRIKEERARVMDHMATGRVETLENYRYLAGTIHGLDVVAREIDDLMVAFEKEQDRG